MNTLRKVLRTGATATLTLELPVSGPGRAFEVIVVWQEIERGTAKWPEGWLEATAGSIDAPTFVRQPQGDFERREPL
jgi:hypothetical protein